MRRIEPFSPRSRGRARVDGRRVISGIIHVFRHGLQWNEARLPIDRDEVGHSEKEVKLPESANQPPACCMDRTLWCGGVNGQRGYQSLPDIA